MKDGRVLVVGGGIASSTTTERVDIFDPKTNVWTEAQPLKSDRASHTAALLNDGRVLVAGGISANDRGSRPAGGDAWLYDPQTDTWTATGPMVTPRLDSASVRLPDGRVLVSGGFTYEDPVPKIWASTEIYDPASNTWTAAANLAQARYTHALVLLPDGQVLAVGGARDADYLWNGNSFVPEIERYDPAANEWRIVGELPEPRAFATATLLPDGRVWLAGGRNDTTSFSDTWLIGAHVE
ncbi:MAG TPA: kelch repeat-containing protein [Anaerolineae bacterium]|nr:kelch repeat-containing protein [Anaerolineae bacterium]